VKKFGRGGFDYAGDSAVDIPVWEAARRAYAVNPEPAAGRWIAQRGDGATTLGAMRRAGRALLRALRPRHWVKNTLVFLPMLAASQWHQGQTWWRLAAFFLALCFGASTVCLINDLADMESDRRHKGTGRNPVATGDLLIAEALLAIPLCLALAVCFPRSRGGRQRNCSWATWLPPAPARSASKGFPFWAFHVWPASACFALWPERCWRWSISHPGRSPWPCSCFLSWPPPNVKGTRLALRRTFAQFNCEISGLGDGEIAGDPRIEKRLAKPWSGNKIKKKDCK